VRWAELKTRDGDGLIRRRHLALVLICAATLAACGSHARRHASPPPPTNNRVERCVDRLVAGSSVQSADRALARRYVRDTYCRRFDQKGWVYEDGALKLAAHLWLQKGGKCAEGVAGQPAKVVPCKTERSGGVLTIECGLLRVVRRSEVRRYLRRLQSTGRVVCDDGRALASLGVP
jgi:hypothetical protein